MDARIPYSFGSAIMLVGAFAIGWVLHQVFIRDAMSIVSPAAVITSIVGLVLIFVGRRLERRFDPGEYVSGPEEDEEEEEFDEEFGPLGEADLEGYDRDETYDR